MSPHHWPRLLVTCWVFTLWVVWNKSGNFLQPQTEIGDSDKTGILTPTHEAKNVCHGLVDQVSSLWWVLIYPNQLIGLFKPKYVSGGILLLRLQVDHLCVLNQVLKRSDNVIRNHSFKVFVFKRCNHLKKKQKVFSLFFFLFFYLLSCHKREWTSGRW